MYWIYGVAVSFVITAVIVVPAVLQWSTPTMLAGAVMAVVFEYWADPAASLKKYLNAASVSNKMPNSYPDEVLRRNAIAYLKEATK